MLSPENDMTFASMTTQQLWLSAWGLGKRGTFA